MRALVATPSRSALAATLRWVSPHTLTTLNDQLVTSPVARAVDWPIWNAWLPRVAQVIDQMTRRVLQGKAVPADEKPESLFEAHADVLVKDRRDTYYGHKIFLTTGRSGLILDGAFASHDNLADCKPSPSRTSASRRSARSPSST